MPDAGPVSPMILLVEDDPAVRASLKFALELEGFGVDAYASAEALSEAGPLPETGCLVLDYRLPGMDGLSLLALLRGREVDMPAVLITSNPTAAIRRRAAAAGVAIVEKPLMGDALADCVRSAARDSRHNAFAQG